jgi:hypothetical protein
MRRPTFQGNSIPPPLGWIYTDLNRVGQWKYHERLIFVAGKRHSGETPCGGERTSWGEN